MAFIDAIKKNGTPGSISYVDFNRWNDDGEPADGVIYDYDSGIAYIPKGLFDSSTENYDHGISAQCMVRYNPENGMGTKVPVTVENHRDNVKVVAGDAVKTNGYDPSLSFQLVSEDTAKNVKASDIAIYADGMDNPLAIGGDESNTFEYDDTTGFVSFNYSAQASTALKVIISDDSMADKVVDAVILTQEANAAIAGVHIDGYANTALYNDGKCSLTWNQQLVDAANNGTLFGYYGDCLGYEAMRTKVAAWGTYLNQYGETLMGQALGRTTLMGQGSNWNPSIEKGDYEQTKDKAFFGTLAQIRGKGDTAATLAEGGHAMQLPGDAARRLADDTAQPNKLWCIVNGTGNAGNRHYEMTNKGFPFDSQDENANFWYRLTNITSARRRRILHFSPQAFETLKRPRFPHIPRYLSFSQIMNPSYSMLVTAFRSRLSNVA